MNNSLDRVIVVTDNAHVNGGNGKVALSSAIGLHQRGIPTTIFSAVGPVSEALTSLDGLEVICMEQMEILNDPNRLAAAARGIWNRAAGEAMKRRLQSADPRRTIVHVHSWTKGLSSSVLAAAIDGGFTVIATLHDYFMACPIGSFFDHQRGEICTVTAMSTSCVTRNCDPRSAVHKAWRIGRHAVQKRVAHVPDGIRHYITISDLSERVLKPYLPSDAVLHTVANPIDVARQAPATPADSGEYIYVGRLSQEKGAVLFAQAAQRFGIRAVFVGEGECASEVEAACPSAEITGWMDHAQVMQRVRGARALVLPSLWYENAPLVILEAAAMGVPSIVPDTSAAGEAIVNGTTGLTFRGGSVEDLCAKLELFRADETVERMGTAAYKGYWERPRSMETHLDALLDVYGSALSGATVPRRHHIRQEPVEASEPHEMVRFDESPESVRHSSL